MKRECCTGDLCNAKAPEHWIPKTTTTTKATTTPQRRMAERTTTTTVAPASHVTADGRLMCYRCDGCTADLPKPDQYIDCGPVETAGCYIASVGFGRDATFVRGCEVRSRCVDLTTSIMKRKCCATPMCNDVPPANWLTQTNLASPITRPPVTTTTTTEANRRRAMDIRPPVDPNYPMSDVDLFVLLDFAGLRQRDEDRMVEMAKQLAVDATMKGAEATLVNGKNLRRLSPLQIAKAFQSRQPDTLKSREVLERFSSELHLSSNSRIQRNRHEPTTTRRYDPEAESTIADSFETLVIKFRHHKNLKQNKTKNKQRRRRRRRRIRRRRKLRQI